jgi:hypothetical protein
MNRREKVKRAKWLGGYVRFGSRSRTYVIDKWVGGVHFHVSTRCSTERAAMKQLERFEVDPFGYTPLGDDLQILTITDELAEGYRKYMLHTKKNSQAWVTHSLRLLAAWEEDLRGKDLRKLVIQRDLKPALDRRVTSRMHRVEVIKAFCTWLRQEKGLLRKGEDATVDLPVPKAVAAKTHRRRAIPPEHVRLVYAKLPEATKDILLLQTATAWHVSEVRRFAKGGEIVRPLDKNPLAVLVTPHKGGELTRTPIVDAEHLAAAERIQARKRIPAPETLVEHLRDACNAVREDQAKAGTEEEHLMPHFRLGDMRHTVLTYAVQQGATPQEASEFANHKSLTTTKKFYIDVAVPTVSVPTLRLVKIADAAG